VNTAVAQHPCQRGRQSAQRLDRALGSDLLDVADDRVDHDHGGDHGGVDLFAERDGDHRRHEQDVDERAAELADEDDQLRRRRMLLQSVRPVARQPGAGLVAAEAIGRPRHLDEDVLGRHGPRYLHDGSRRC